MERSVKTDPPGFEPQSLPALTVDISRAATAALDDLAAAVSVERRVLREGDPATEILAAAREVQTVMLTRPRKTGYRRRCSSRDCRSLSRSSTTGSTSPASRTAR
jgi:hypothetical protein